MLQTSSPSGPPAQCWHSGQGLPQGVSSTNITWVNERRNPSKDKDRLQSERKLGGLAFLVVPDGTSDFISPSQPQTESGSNASDKSDKCLISKALITYTGDIIKDLLCVRRQLRKTAVRLFSRKAKLRLLLPVNGVWLSQVTFR